MVVQLRGCPWETEKMKKSGMKGRLIAIASIGLVCLMALSVFAPVASAATAPTWNYSYALGAAKAQSVVVQADNGVVYIMGGVTAIVYTENTLARAYNPSTGIWAGLTAMPTATRGACGEIGADGRIYVLDGTAIATQIYNITTNAWSLGAVNPLNQWEAKSAVNGNNIYAFGGAYSGQNSTQIYDIIADTWSSGQDMPYGVHAGAVVYDSDYAYYIGGENDSGDATTNVSRYNFASDSWSRLAPLPSGLAGEAAIIGPDGLIYVFGGANEALNWQMADVYAGTYTYDRTTDTWATVDDLNVPRAWLGAALDGDKILALGGNNQTVVYTTVETLDTLPNQLNNLQKQVTLLQNQLTQANNDIAGLEDDLVTANNETAQLKQQLVDLSAELNQTMIDLNAAQGSANNAKSAADSANMIGMIGIIIGIVAIVIAVIALVMKKKAPIQRMQPQPPMPPQ